MKYILIISAMLIVSCGNNPKTTENKPKKQELFRLVNPQNGATLKAGDKFTVAFKPLNDTLKADSCTINIDGKRFVSFASPSVEMNTAGMKMGIRRLSLNIYSGGKVAETLPFALKITPSAAPKRYGYSVVKEYPHDAKAYTQGLFWHDGFMYEGTGQKGASTLRKVELSSGKVLQNHKLDDEYFGEGICVHNGKIYQLTWESRVGFIYNMSDFTLQGKFNYSSEGWGITTDGTHLWMSDGTSNLYMLNPDDLSILDVLEVYTDKGKIDSLNELEFINGEIWANVYTEDIVLRIDPKTGQVTGIIDFKGLLKKELYTSDTNVLNGIAYDESAKRIFVTGKNWPLLFEIKLTEK